MFVQAMCLAMFASAAGPCTPPGLPVMEKHYPNLTILLIGDRPISHRGGYQIHFRSDGVFRGKSGDDYSDRDLARVLRDKTLISRADGILYATIRTEKILFGVLRKVLSRLTKLADPNIKTVIEVRFDQIIFEPDMFAKIPYQQRIQFKLVTRSPKGRQGWSYVLLHDDNNGIYDLAGKRVSGKLLRKFLRATIRKGDREESILSISMHSVDEMKMACLANVVKEILEQRDSQRAAYIYFTLLHGTDFTSSPLNKLHVEFEYETLKTKNGWDVLLRSEGLFDFQGKKLSREALRKMLRSTFRNNERDESVLYIHIYDVENSKLIFLVNALAEIETLKDPKIPTYVFVDLSRF